MEHGDLLREDLHEQVNDIDDHRLAPRSIGTYRAANKRLLLYLQQNNPIFIVDGSIDAQMLHDNVIVFKGFVTTLYNGGNQFSSLCAYRSALIHLLKEAKVIPSDIFSANIKGFYEGLKRMDAQRKRREGVTNTVGKEAMPWALLCKLAKYCLSKGSEKYLFVQAYMVLSWHLMCRCNSTMNLAYGRIHWRGDSLAIHFVMSKSDQTGERLKDPIHVYANPLQPEVCPVLALGLYLMNSGSLGADGLLFSGNSQDHRFSNLLKELLDECKEMVKSCGLQPGHLGSHSLRKGSVSFVLGGSTSGPGVFSVFSRAGWKQGIVQEKYIKYQAAGDQHVGRTVAGLPLDSTRFATLPPHFIKQTTDDELFIHRVLKSHFSPTLLDHANLWPVLEHCLASLYYHRPNFLAHNLADTSPLRRGRLYSSTIADANRLRAMIVVKTFRTRDMRATGIPPHISQMYAFAGLRESVTKIPEELLAGVTHLLEQRAADAGQMTPSAVLNSLKQMLVPIMAQMAQQQALRMSGHPLPPSSPSAADSNVSTEAATEEVMSRCTAHFWGGGVFIVPQDWTLPNVNVSEGWRYWTRGHLGEKVPPLRTYTSRDLGPRVSARDFSEWNVFFGYCETFLKAIGRWVADPTDEDSLLMFSYLEPLFNTRHGREPSVPTGRRKRPASDLKVMSIAKKFRRLRDEEIDIAVAQALQGQSQSS